MKLHPILYQKRFEKQVESFIDNFSSFPLQVLNPLFLGISGGVDSIGLLLFAHKLSLKFSQLKIHVLHFNHQSRPKENRQEQEFVENLCHKLQISCTVGFYEESLHREEAWRQARYDFFHQTINSFSSHESATPFSKSNAQLWLAHHLDDSFEWSMMQQCKSGNLQGMLGIPVRHGHIFRPFLSVTKKQILQYIKSYQQTYLEDSSNLNPQYERNWWRINLLKKIKKKYPQVLKHYVQRSMELALKLNLVHGQTEEGSLHILDEHTHILKLKSHQKILHSLTLIKKSLHSLSSHQRMKLYKQLRILFDSYEKGKKGPIYFSGGVRVYITSETIILTNQKNFDLQKIRTT
jgi:tRNA(Ile)-lysidine synthase